MSSFQFLCIPSSPVFQGGFTPWQENQDDLFSILQSPPLSPQNPVNSNSGSDEPNQPVFSPDDERKKRRMLSNRESARRSRERKQRHLEDLRNQLNRLKIQKRDLVNRLGFVNHYGHLLKRDNDLLRSESEFLRQRLSDIRRILIFRQFQPLIPIPFPSNTVTVNEQPLLA